MVHREVQPHPALRPYVQLIWCFELEAGEGAAPERVAPDGIVELVFHYRTPVVVRAAGEAPSPQPRTALVSQTRRWIEFSSAGSTGFLSVRFRPWGAHHFLPLPVSAIADQVVDARQVWGEEVPELEERLALAPGASERIDLVEAFLLRRLSQHHARDVEPLVRAVWDRRGRLRVPELCEALGIGERRCQRLFGASLGVTPKGFARVTRFLSACERLRGEPSVPLADVALECGYYDQSHFTSEVRSLSGLTPRQLRLAPVFSFLRIGD